MNLFSIKVSKTSKLLIISLLILSLIVFSEACKIDPDEKKYKPELPARASSNAKPVNEILSNLDNAYAENSQDLLTDILYHWYDENVPKDTSIVKDSTHWAIYEIVREFYTPWTFNRILSDGSTYNKDHVLVPEKVPYRITKDLNNVPTYFPDTIFECWPDYKSKSNFYIYTSENYKQALYRFIGLDEQPLPYWDINKYFVTLTDSINFGEVSYTTEIAEETETIDMGGSLYTFEIINWEEQRIDTLGKIYPQPTEEMAAEWASRTSFLNNKIPVGYEYHFHFWDVYVYPEIRGIALNDSINDAVLYYHFKDEYGKARYTKSDSIWGLVWYRQEWN